MSDNLDDKNLYNHLKLLSDNPDRYLQDKERAVNTWVDTAYKSYGKCGKKCKYIKALLKQLAYLVFEAQGGKSLYEYSDELPRAWNRSQHFHLNYIKWETGHLKSRNCDGLNNPENLCFLSARCNQHIQSGLNYTDTTEYKYVEEVKKRVNNILALHETKEWKEIKDKIEVINKNS